jgi:hypothetical protein
MQLTAIRLLSMILEVSDVNMEKQLFWLEFIHLKSTYYNNASIYCGLFLADYCFDLSLF